MALKYPGWKEAMTVGIPDINSMCKATTIQLYGKRPLTDSMGLNDSNWVSRKGSDSIAIVF